LRILIIVDCYYPSPKSSAKLAHDMGVELQRRGNEVVVLAPSEEASNDLVTSLEDKLLIARVRTGRIKGAGRVWRAVEEAQLSRKLWWRAKRFLAQKRCDLIVFYSPSIFFGPLVRKLKALWKCPAYLILRDIFPEWAVDAGLLRKGLVYHFFRRMETYQYETADVIAVQCPANLEYFARAYPKKEFRLKVLYNWALLEVEDLPQTNYRVRLGVEKGFAFLYGGNIGVAQDMNNLVRLAERMAWRADVHFVLIGCGSETERLKGAIAERRLRNVHVLPAVSQSEYLSLVSEFDAGLLSLDARIRTHNIPSKLLGYLYWGLPVLASVNRGNDLFEVINRNRAGFCCANGDHEELVAAASRLVDEPELRGEMSRNARRLLEQTFSAKKAAEQIFKHIAEEGFTFAECSAAARIRPNPIGPDPVCVSES
jgi:glycosyltransferase involved in cell wall biosynthesis